MVTKIFDPGITQDMHMVRTHDEFVVVLSCLDISKNMYEYDYRFVVA